MEPHNSSKEQNVQNKIPNEAGGPSLCSVDDCCRWKLSFIQTVVVRTSLSLFFSPLPSFCRRFSWSLDMITSALCVRSNVHMCRECRRIKGEQGARQTKPWWFFLFIVNTITRALATSGFFFLSYRLNMCSSVHILPSAGWHRKEVITPPLVTPVSLTEGRQEQICPTQLNCGYLSKTWLVGYFVFLVMSTA